jgi:hypothetical protein
MLGQDIFILPVTIPVAVRVSKVDTRWFDQYCADPRPEYIDNYWHSVPSDPVNPTWEYLVDGVIEVDDPTALERIRVFGARP